MLTKLTVRNFKRFDNIEIELGSPVVFIGPNNSGKTTALQVLALWEIGVRRWFEKHGERATSPTGKRTGVAINRKDLIAVPVPNTVLLWLNQKVRAGTTQEGRFATQNIRIDVKVDGITEGKTWSCGLEFDYANEESFYCRPLRVDEDKKSEVPIEAKNVRLAFLPPMSGLAAQEFKLDPGAINVFIGEGQTAQVLRNLCYQIYKPINSDSVSSIGNKVSNNWEMLVEQIKKLFGVQLYPPEYIGERGEIVMSYKEGQTDNLDLSASGRGLQQTLLLLSYMYANPGAVLLLDEPDAHLEILRQRQIYQLLTEVAQSQGNQIIAATHSEVVLNEAAGRDTVIAFVGRKPHRIDDRGSQLLKSLKDIGFDQYYQAEDKRWVLYLEGSTDLAILRSFAKTLNHSVAPFLERPFVHYVANQVSAAREHFFGLKDAVRELRGIAIFDRQEVELAKHEALNEMMWQRREMENYLCAPDVLRAFARSTGLAGQGDNLFTNAEATNREQIMDKLIKDFVPPVALRDLNDKWWMDIKASDEFLDRIFGEYFKQLGLPNLMSKTSYHILATFVPKGLVSKEVIEKLDIVYKIAMEIEKKSS